MESGGRRLALVGVGLGCIALAMFAFTMSATPRADVLEFSAQAKSSKAMEMHRSHRSWVLQQRHSAHASKPAAHSKKARTTGLNMNCCQCDGSSVDLPAVPCQDCYGCAKKPYSPYYNPYGDRKDKQISTLPKLLQEPLKKQKEGFLLSDEKDAATPTDRMLTLNKIIEGSKNFVAPPRTPDVYQIVTKKIVHKDPIVQVS